MKSYAIENGIVDLALLKADLMPLDSYKEAHQALVISCHDIMVFLEEKKSWLLIHRNNKPATDILWPLGGRIIRGMATLDSAIQKVREESQLEITDIEEVGYARTFFQTDPFGHGHGTDTLNVLLVARAKGEISLNALHESPTFIGRNDFTPEFQEKLHPYVKDFFDLAWNSIEQKSW